MTKKEQTRINETIDAAKDWCAKNREIDVKWGEGVFGKAALIDWTDPENQQFSLDGKEDEPVPCMTVHAVKRLLDQMRDVLLGNSRIKRNYYRPGRDEA